MIRHILISGLLLTVTAGCISDKTSDAELQKFSSLFVGSFSTKEQAFKDSTYRSMILRIAPIWKKKAGHWMFAEWTDGNNASQIIQRRIIQLERLDSITILSKFYKLPEITETIDPQKIIARLDDEYKEKYLLRSSGCDMSFIKQTSNIYVGKTDRNSCKSSVSGISYITSHIVISSNRLTQWTKGFDTSGKQVWGKINGPYQYKRIEN